MEFSERVVVLQLGTFRETDLWVRVLSPSRGVFSAFAFGGSRSKRRFVGCLDIFNLALFRIQYSAKTSFFSLLEGVLLKGPQRLRSDWRRLGVAHNCSLFIQAFGVSLEGAEQAHALFVEMLEVLEEAEIMPQLLPFYFRLRLAAQQGYSLNVYDCAGCGCALQGPKVFFDVRAGQMLCPACLAKTTSRPMMVTAEALTELKIVIHEPIHSWGNTLAVSKDRFACSQVIDSFIQYHVGLAWEYGRFSRM